MKVVIIGGVAGGASCATRLRRLDESAQIIVFERGDHVSYANCGLPYYVGGKIEREESLTVASPGFLRARFAIDVRVRSEVVGIDTASKTVRVRERDGREYEESYDKLVLAPGAAAKTFGWSGEGVFVLRDVNDAVGLASHIGSKSVKKALVAGGGFIGVETAENLVRRGVAVTLAEFAPQVMPPLDPEMALLVADELAKNGVAVRTGVGVSSVTAGKDGVDVTFTDGSADTFGAVVLALGVTPETSLAKAAGIAIAPDGGIAVDECMRTSVADVYAAGDAVSVTGADGGETLVPLAGPANRQGRSVADNICGGSSSNGKRVLGASVVRAFGLTAASVGRNEKQLKKSGERFFKVYAFPFSHATYYPGAAQMALKLLFAPDGRVLGAQGAGAESVEKQMDVISAAMKFGGSVRDLAEMELCYAPPFNSAKSPVNMLGFIACNVLDGLVRTVSAEDVGEEDFVLDVRTPQEFAAGHIADSVNIPLDELRERLGELPRDTKITVTCAVGLRGYIAARVLAGHGFDAVNLTGGFRMYSMMKRAGLVKNGR